MAISYHHLVNHIVPGPQSFSYGVPLVLLPIALLIHPTTLSHRALCILFLPVIVAAIAHAWLAMRGVDVISANALLWSIYLLGIKDPRKDFVRIVRRQTQSSHNQKERISSKEDNQDFKDSLTKKEYVEYDEVTYPMAFLPRLYWVGTLLISLRLSDWKINDPSHDKHQPGPPTSKTHYQFIRTAILRSISGYLIVDLTAYFILSDPYFHDLRTTIFTPLPSHNQPLSYLSRITILALQSHALISQQYYLPLLLPVTLSYLFPSIYPTTWSPHIWPAYFGPLSALLTSSTPLATFWGKYWHQTMRYMVSGPAEPLSDALGLARTGSARWILLTLVAFVCSGVVHMGLVPPEPLHSSLGAAALRACIGGFFWVQPLGLMFERLVAALLMRIVPRELRRSNVGQAFKAVLNVAWIMAWSCCCFPLVGEVARQLGWFTYYPVPYSLIRGLKDGDWITWDILK